MAPAARRLPPNPFPFGWFHVGVVARLAIGEVRPVQFAGGEWVLWRGEDGIARVNSAYCGHLGAHLAHGGCVVGTTLRCPFHHWRWNADGSCAEMPRADAPHPTARITALNVVEAGNAILAWWHPAGADPLWEPLRVPERDDPGWTRCGHHEWHIATHWQEVIENTVDSTHFHHVHGTVVVPEIDLHVEGYVLSTHAHHALPTSRGAVPSTVKTMMRGPGQGTIRFVLPEVVELLAIQHLTTTVAGEVRMRMDFLVRGVDSRDVDLGRRLAGEIVEQVDEDVPIWAYKRFQDPPRLAQDDGPILRFRRWAAQFAA